MTINLHYPPTYETINDHEPLLFLAGPIQGAPDWQKYATNTIRGLSSAYDIKSSLHIANPRREYLDRKFDYYAQVDWEKYHLKRAAQRGGILVWFAAQDHSLPYEEGREYAKTTKDELTRVIGWLDYNPNINVVVGIEPGFKSINRYKMTCLEEYNLGEYTDLDLACNALVKSMTER